MPDLAPRTLLKERYLVLRPLGKGGMGAVYEAVDTRLHNTVAVKQITIDGVEANRAFEREARLLAGLRHATLPVVIDYFAEGGRQFLVMQYIEGEDLAHLLKREGRPFEHHELTRCAAVLAGALDYLHRRDPPIVHRDLKPANINRTPAGEYVLLDFGLAKGHGDSDSTVAVDQRSVYGFTPTYAPPEQIQGLPTDPRSDIFALGATLFHLAAGVPPPPALERLACVSAGTSDPLDARLAAIPGLGETIRSAIARALALDAGDRFQAAAEILDALTAGDAPRRAAAPVTSSDARRIDAALPSQAEVGRPIDLIVQVRFADSPSLGLEDWPSKRRPDRIEQSSEPLDLVYPIDPRTRTQLPARVRIRIVAPDFTIAGGASEQILAVPPRDYSKRLAFLLTAARTGICRVNVEVYAPDAAFLGMLAIEAEALDRLAAESALRVANLDLRVVAERAQVTPATGAFEPDTVAAAMLTARASAHEGALNPPPVVLASGAPPSLPPDAASPSHIGRWIAAASAAVVLVAVGVTMLVPRNLSVPPTAVPNPRESASNDQASGRSPQATAAASPPTFHAPEFAPGPPARSSPPAPPGRPEPGPPSRSPVQPGAPVSDFLRRPSVAPSGAPPPPAPSPAPQIGRAPRIMSATTSGVFKLALDGPVETTFDQAGCRYTMSVRDLDAAIYIREGVVSSAGINARLVQRAEAPCTSAEISKPLSHTFSRVRGDAAQVTLEFISESMETVDVGLSILVPSDSNDAAVPARLMWSKRPPATWTIRAAATFVTR